MLKPTKSHKKHVNKNENIFTIKIGEQVPSQGVSLAYFYNKGSNVTSKNILSVASPKNSIDHIDIVDYRDVKDLKSKDNNVFDNSISYNDDDGYIGTLYRVGVEWFEKKKEDMKFFVLQNKYTALSQMKVPSSVEHTDGVMSGTLFLTKETYVPTDWREKVISNTYKKKKTKILTVDGLRSPSHTFNQYIDEVDGDYKGQLKLEQGSVEYTEINNESTVKSVTITKEYIGVNPSYPTTVNYEYNGQVYQIPMTSKISSSTEIKHYGVTRYWGYSTTGLYGTKDRKYAATSDGGKGYFKNDTYPAQISNRYGHFPTDAMYDYKNLTIKSAYTGWREIGLGSNKLLYPDEIVTKVDGVPYSLGNKYTSYYNYDTVKNKSGVTQDIFDGTEWTYDLAKAASYGAPNNLSHGGCIWASQYIQHTSKFPPEGYEKDNVWKGDQHMVLVTDNYIVKNNKYYYPGDYINIESKTYKASDIIKINNYAKNGVQYNDFVLKRNCLFTGVTRSTAQLAYPGNQQYSKMTMMFYKGRTRSTRVTYSTNIIIEKGSTYTAKATYSGDLEMKVDSTETYPVEWECSAVYEGNLKHFYSLYDGLATFRGIAIKRSAVGNLSPNGVNESVMFPNDEGLLLYDLDDRETSVIEGQNFMITDVYYDKTPLYKSYMLSEYIYDLDGPNQAGLYDGNSIKLVDENNIELKKPYLYKIKLIATEFDDLYTGIVFTSFDTSSNKNIYCVYNSCKPNGENIDINTFKSGTKELIYVQPAYQINRDYKLIELDGLGEYRKSQIKVFDYVRFKDYRKKVPVVYVIKTNDNQYVSNPINANVLNRQYAFESEYDQFQNNGHIISPMYDKVYLTATDILVRDLGIQSWQLKGKQIIAELYNTSSSMENSLKVYLYTHQDGSGYVLAETSEETGFLNNTTNEYDKTYNFDSMYHLHSNYICSAFSVINKDIKSIELNSPDQNNNITSWYARIKFGNFSQVLEQYNNKTKITYSIPEFSKQLFNSVDGEPYKHVDEEQVEILNSHEIRVSKYPMFVKFDKNRKLKNLFLYKKNMLGQNESVTAKSWSYKEGIITLEEYINDTDKIYATYDYEEEDYIYRGYYENGNFIDLNLNPSIYHDYLDTTIVPYERRKTVDLLNKIIYFFIKPKRVEDTETNVIFADNDTVVYHKFDDSTPKGEHDLLIGKVLVRHNTSLKSTVLVDTRQRGGGVIAEIYDNLRKELEPESDYYFDIGCYDGNMYSENATIIIRFNNEILEENGGKFTKSYISNIIEKWKAFGVHAIIEYVDAISNTDTPNEVELVKL